MKPSNQNPSRRKFLIQSTLIPAGILAARLARPQPASGQTTSKPAVAPPPAEAGLPQGKLGSLKVSRLILGANLISGWGHYRDLLFVGNLAQAYNTKAKVMDTLALAEAKGINTIMLNYRQLDIISRYRQERGGAIQTIVGVEPEADAAKAEAHVQSILDQGVSAAYIDGVYGDKFVRDGSLESISRILQQIRQSGRPAGVGAHSLQVPKTCENRGLNPDFYVKSFHHDRYWSATPKAERRDYCWYDQWSEDHSRFHDNIWCLEPEETSAFMEEVEKPWIAFKVLAAGAIAPRSGFQYAFEHGADFIAVGMYDFEIGEDVAVADEAIRSARNRTRAWHGPAT